MSDAVEALDTQARSLYFTVWMWLVVLLVAGLVIFLLPISRIAAIMLIFAVAAVKAALVIRNYMHLKQEHLFLYLLALVPALLFIGLAFMLLPDIVFRHHLGFGG